MIQSARDYARICNAIYEGVHLTLLRSEGRLWSDRGAREQRAGDEASIHLPDRFRAAKAAGMRNFDAYAHHPYAGDPVPSSARPRNPRAITFANIGKLIDEVTILYGEKPIWITEYGYETSPPDRIFGVSWDRQATYMHEAYTIARRNPRIDMLLWFLVRDEGRATGWQSGLVSARGLRKPVLQVPAARGGRAAPPPVDPEEATRCSSGTRSSGTSSRTRSPRSRCGLIALAPHLGGA